MAQLHILRVFTGDEGADGNKLGVFLDGAEVREAQRQAVAREIGFSETVFVDDAETGAVRIFTPEVEFDFAGHPMVGTAWLIARETSPPRALYPPAGEVAVRFDGEVTWVSGRPEWAPGGEHIQLKTAAEVEALDPIESGDIFFWAWIDEAAGTVRARCFAPDVGIVEDEATGSAALKLSGDLDRPIVVHQGRGSVIEARPLGDGLVEVGGRVALDEERDHPVPG